MKIPGLRLYWQDWFILGLLWFGATTIDLSWLILDHSPPAWDQGEHLTRALHYWNHLRTAEWFSGSWWQNLWELSPGYRGPFVYLLTVPLFTILGRGFVQAALVNSLLTGPLMGMTYLLGQHLFDRRTGLLAAASCLFLPSLVLLRTDYLIDYGLCCCVLATFLCLTYWYRISKYRWFTAMGIGLTLGATLLAKPTGLLFFIIPFAWLIGRHLWKREWISLAQLALALALAGILIFPWVQTNWLTILTNSSRSSVTWVPAGVIPGNRWSAWSYYARTLPFMLSKPLLYIPLGAWVGYGLVQGLGRFFPWIKRTIRVSLSPNPTAWGWLLGFIGGSYAILSLLKNKDPRHILPYAPMVMVALMRGFTLWRRPLVEGLSLVTLGIATVITAGSLFPLPLPQGPFQHRPNLNERWPHAEVIQKIVETDPYVQSTLGVLPNTATLNPMNFSFYGALEEFRVAGREIGFTPDAIASDRDALTWYVTKTGEGGPKNSPNEAKADVAQQLEESLDIRVEQEWPLPDGSQLSLLRRKVRPVRVYPYNQDLESIKLDSVEVPPTAPPGSTIPVTYRTVGPWDKLQQGILLLTWQPLDSQYGQWIHDHGLGAGHLYTGLTPPEPAAGFKVEEYLAMAIPADARGRYQLKAQYLDRQTGETIDLAAPSVTVQVKPENATPPAPTLDLNTRLRQLSEELALGEIDALFSKVGYMNQYDPDQDYLEQTEQAMTARLATQPDQLDWQYAKLLAQVLQQKGNDAIATAEAITELIPDEPYAWAYLGFLNLYQFKPGPANRALEQAAKLNPDLPNLKLLQGVAAVYRFNLPKGIRLIQEGT